MNRSDATFELVKSLTQNEKRYFRVFSGSSGSDKNYLKVFDALDKMKEYDAKSLSKKLAAAKLNLSYEKNYLQKQLLKTLRVFYSETNSAVELQDILKSIELLYRKRLTAHCEKLAERGLALCEKYGQWNYHLELIDWRSRIIARSGNYSRLGNFANEGGKEKQALCTNILLYAAIQADMYFITVTMQTQSLYLQGEALERFREIMQRCELLLKEHGTNFRIADLLYSALYLAAHYSGDLEKAYEYALENYKLYLQHPHYRQDLPFKFFVASGSLVNRCIHLKKYSEGLNYIAELKTFLQTIPTFAAQDIRQEQYSAIFGYETNILLATRRFKEALKAAQEFERGYDPVNMRRNDILHDRGRLARIYFVNGLKRESLQYANELINSTVQGVKLEFLTYAHLVRLCIQYDLGNYELLTHLARTTQRFLRKHKASDKLAYAFIELMLQLGKTANVKNHKAVFAAQVPVLKENLEAAMEYYSDLLSWVEKKATDFSEFHR